MGNHMSFAHMHYRLDKIEISHDTHELSGMVFFKAVQTPVIELGSYGTSKVKFYWEDSPNKCVAKFKTLLKHKGYDIKDFE